MTRILTRISGFAVLITALTVIQLFAPASAQAAVCKIKLDNHTTIIGKGSDRQLALEDAADQCFTKRAKELSPSQSTQVSEALGQEIIDECGNLSCGS